jgi:nicotinic acid mononucleotide adenylyltransferase
MRPRCDQALQFLGVDEVLLRMPAAEEQHRLAQRLAALDLRRALLQEAAERRQARAGPTMMSGRLASSGSRKPSAVVSRITPCTVSPASARAR